MRLLTFLLCISSFAINPAKLISQNAKIKIEASESLTVDEVFKLIRNQTDYRFIYQEDLFNNAPKVYVKKGEIPVKDLLGQFLTNNDYVYELTENNTILIKDILDAQEKQFRVFGTVSDKEGMPLMGVNVLLKGKSSGTVTDMDGKFKLLVTKDDVLVFSFIGYTSKEIVVEDQSALNVVLDADVSELSEVVITGYYERKAESFTGAQTTISGKELTALSSQNVLKALSIAVPAFKLVENNDFGSDPNRLPDFEIRGGSSINTDLNSEFQNNPNLPTFILDGFEVSAEIIFDLDPNRVANVTVLRDAAATAIYGSRAANGVVVIETNKPKAGKLNIYYNANLDFTAADLSDYNLMNASEKLEYERLAGLYSHPNVNVNEQYQEKYNELLTQVQKGVNTDWIAIPVRELGVANSHSLFLEGGDDHFLYAFNLTHNETVGAMKGSNRNRNGISIKLQHNRDKLRFMNTLSFNKVNSKNSKYGNFSTYTYQNPYFYPYDVNGNVNEVLYTYNDGTQVPNYLYNATLNIKDESEYSNLLNNFSFSWDINDALRLTSRIGLNLKKGSSDYFLPADHTSFANSSVKGRYTKGGEDAVSFDGNLVLSYNKTFAEKHLLNTTGIYNISESKIDSYSFVGENYPNSNLDHISMGTQYQTGGSPGGDYQLQRLVGLVGNVNYSYDNRYVADVSVRADASSLFGANDRWGTFFSGGIGWNLHKESFLQDQTIVQLLKVRASYGQTGGTRFNPFQSFMMYNYNNPALDGLTYNGDLGALLIALGNPDLKWQKNDKFNLGLDFALFSNKLTGNFNYYNEVSKNQLINVTLAPSVGFPTYTENLGKVRNKGIELSMKYAVINAAESKLKWDVFVNVLHNKNSLLEINEALTAFNERQDELAGDVTNPVTRPLVKYEEGRSINTIWAVESKGIDPATGNEIFVDRNGNLTNDYNFADQKAMAVQDPDIEGNFGTFLRYSNFELGAYFSYRLGGYTYNQTLVDKVENVNPRSNADKRVLYDRWKAPGDVVLFKAISNTSKTYPTSRFIEKDNELRMSSLNLSYNFDNTILDKWGINRLRMSLIANDVFRVNTSNIERGLSYPFARYYSFNLQVSL
ncbi:SusC/RagA family TonB-linked outer membrane protein [Aestuariibaculum suncheonense]|nr:SusC/RagA family TonB-linked outer membrane protein [Aestuariibaculum suncheonense]